MAGFAFYFECMLPLKEFCTFIKGKTNKTIILESLAFKAKLHCLLIILNIAG